MIKADKDYQDIPHILASVGNDSTKTEPSIFGHPAVREKLRSIYHDKCAYCESEINFFSSHVIIDHYRPQSRYYWLAYEWSNLLPACEKCSRSKGNQFPVSDERNRITSPQNRREWPANSVSFSAEKPLLLNPEIDNPEDYLAFYPDGRIYAIGDNIKGNTTIHILNLNRAELVLQRKKLIDNYLLLFERQLVQLFKLGHLREDIETDSLLNLAFGHPFNDLLKQTQPQAEYALLARNMVRSFSSFFIDSAKNTEQKQALEKAFESFISERKVKVRIPSLKPEFGKISVRRLKINNIKCFDNAEIEFRKNSNLILGINGRGKSAILQLLALGLSELEKPPFMNDWFNVVKSGKGNAGFEIQLNTDDDILTLKFTIDEDDKIKCVKNAEKYKLIKSRLPVLAYGPARNTERGEASQDKRFDSIASLFGVNACLKHIRDSGTYNYIQAGFEQIRTVTNKIFRHADESHTFELADFDTNHFYFRTPTNPCAGHSGLIPLESMSDGFKSVFVWLFDMMIRAWEKGVDIRDTGNLSGIVMIDEIDNHLHPAWQRKILPVLEEIFPNIQFIITSHSPFVAQSMNTDNITLFSVKDEGVEASKLPLDGKPYGYEIEKINRLIMGTENDLPEISDRLFEWLKELEYAVEKADKKSVPQLYKKIKEIIPEDSSFNEYLEIMRAGLH